MSLAAALAALADDRAVLGALVRGTLSLRDFADLAPRWWARDDADAVARALGQLHGEILCACEASIEAWGQVRIRPVLALVGPAAGVVHEGRVLGYLPDLARRAPARTQATLALGRLLYAAENEGRARRHHEAGAGVVRALAGVLATAPTAERLQLEVAGMAAALRRAG